MPAYDPGFSPPAPVADVVIAHPVTSASSSVLRGKVDTGFEGREAREGPGDLLAPLAASDPF